ncbi:MAG: MFS transporter, partial [Clostridia bacterium]|nr:MFS transporter [Clostridia bacterium]
MSAGSQLKLNIPKTMLIGLGFLAVSMAWSVYAAYVPLILTDEFKLDSLTVGVIMTIDNIFAVLFQPLFGRLSDKTKTKWGRRMPYVLICAPICAMLFAVIPHMRMIVTFMLTVISFNLLMSAWRSPVVALVPDVTPSPLRSQGNGIINLMGGIGSALAMLLGGGLANIGGMQLPFL